MTESKAMGPFKCFADKSRKKRCPMNLLWVPFFIPALPISMQSAKIFK